jgi:hypothetical protein
LSRWGTGAQDRPIAFKAMPRSWFWMQLVIVVFVVAGMVIAITKLA